MDFRLKVFLEVAQHLSFTKAAKELCISQPAISKHIQELEATYKVQLFSRQNGKIILTHKGEILRGYAQQIIAMYEELSDTMQMVSADINGQIRIGASSSVAGYMLSPLLADFLLKFPNVKVTLTTANVKDIECDLERGAIDIAIVDVCSGNDSLKYDMFAQEELVVVTNGKTSCAANISLGEITQLPVVLEEVGSSLMEEVEKSLGEYGIGMQDLNILLHMREPQALINFILSREGCYTIVPVLAVSKELLSGELKVVNIDNVTFGRSISFVTKAGVTNDNARGFVNFSKLWYSNIYE